MTSGDTQDRLPDDEPGEAQRPPPSEDGPPPHGRAPAEPVSGSDDTPLAQDLSSDLPVAEPVTPAPIPIAGPVPIPVAEEVAPPKPKPKAPPQDQTRKAPPTQRPAAEKPRPAASEPPCDAEEPPPGEGEPPPKRRRRRILLVLAAAILLLVAFAPTILSLGPARQYVLDAVNARLPIAVGADGWSLSWLGDQQVTGLSVQMPGGERVTTARDVRLEESLLAMLLDRGRLGMVRVEEAEVWAGGLKRAIAALAAEQPGEAPPRPKPPVPPLPARFIVPDAIAIKDLTVHTGPATARVAQAQLCRGKDADTFQADLQIRRGAASGSASVEATLTGLSSDWQGAGSVGVEGAVTCADLPMAALWAVAAEFGVPFDGAGRLTAKAAFSRGRSGEVAVTITRCTAKDLSLAGEPLHGDTPRLESLDLEADATYAAGLITVGALRLRAPVATMTASGTFALAAAEARPPTGTGAATLTLQIGRIAQMFPRTLGLHADLTVESGTLEATVEASSDAKRSRLTFDARLSDVRGTRGGQSVVLSPVRLAADLERAHAPAAEADAPAPAGRLALVQRIRVNDLTATAAGGTVKAAGRLEAFTLDAQLDLAKATEQVGRFVDLRGYGAAGAAVVGVRTEGTLGAGVKTTLTSTFTDLVLRLGGGGRLAEPKATLTATARATFDDAHRLSGATVDAFDLAATTASLAAKGFVQRTMASWEFNGSVGGSGTVANLGGLAVVILPLVPSETASETAGEAGGGWRETLLAYAHRASGRGGKPADGRWQLKVEAGGALDQEVAVNVDAAVTDLVWPLDKPSTKPLQIARGTVRADVRYHLGEEAGNVTIHSVEATIPGASAVVKGPATMAVDGSGALDGTLDAVVAAALPTLAQTLAPLDLLPAEAACAGDVRVHLTASPTVTGPALAKAKLTVVGERLDVAWPDGRRFSDPLLQFTADAALLRKQAGEDSEGAVAPAAAPDALAAIEIADWSLATVAGTLKGTAGVARAETGWHWQVAAGGDGAIRPLAQTIARLRGRPAGEIRGLWNLKATYDSRSGALGATADATNLTVPQEGDLPLPDLHLDNIHLETTAAYTEDGLLRIDAADLTGPGMALQGTGTVRLPRDGAKASADGAVTAKADLARFSQVLAPFGLLPEGVQLAGTADFEGNVASRADGFGGDGVLQIANLDVRMPASKTAIRETRVHLPVTFRYHTAQRRWDASTEAMEAETATGTWRVAVTDTDAGPLLDAACNLEFDAERVRAMLGERLPATVRLSGPWRLVANLAGPLPDEDAWHRRIARLEGNGRIDVKRFEYETLTGGDGAVHWALGGKRITFSPDRQEPDRLALAGGHIVLGGYIDLAGEAPRLVVTERLQVLDRLPLEGKQVQDYLRYASPVLAASVSARGNLSLALDRLVVPLGGDPREKDLPDEQKTPIARRVSASGQYWIDGFQSELIGPLGKLLQTAAGGPARTVEQRLGPVRVVMQRGILRIEEHDLRYAEAASLRFGGTIGVDKRMNVIVGVPLTPAMLARYKVSDSAMPYVKDMVIAVPLTGTIDQPRVDDRAFAKRMGQIAVEAIKRKALEHLGDWLKGTLK